jgi:hypothetical protein
MNLVPYYPSTEYQHAEWRDGRYVLAELKYLFGQHRIQVWHYRQEDDEFPDVIGIQFDTYKPEVAREVIEKIIEAFKDISSTAPPDEAGGATETLYAMAIEYGMDPEDYRCRIDNFRKEPENDGMSEVSECAD